VKGEKKRSDGERRGRSGGEGTDFLLSCFHEGGREKKGTKKEERHGITLRGWCGGRGGSGGTEECQV